jgi:hypothetical protein
MKNLLIYGSIFDSLDDLTNEEAGMLFKALNAYRKGKEVKFEDRYLKGLWQGIKPNLDNVKNNYDNKVKANQENGKKGGRPKKEENTDTLPTKVEQSIQHEEKAPQKEEKNDFNTNRLFNYLEENENNFNYTKKMRIQTKIEAGEITTIEQIKNFI